MVSIVIPTFNRASFISETLESVLKQTYSNWECIIVDDGSTDDTEQIVNDFITKDKRFKFYKRPEYLLKGANSCRNFGFEKAKGEFIQWFDSDDIMLENFLSIKIAEFNENIEFVICSGYNWNSDANIKNAICFFELENSLFEEYVQWKIKILTPSVLFRKKFLEDKDLFNNEIKRGQETEFFSRIFFKIKVDKYKIIPHYLFLYRQHNDSKTFKNLIYNPEYKRSLFYILNENFKRAQLEKIIILQDYIYIKIVDLFFLSIVNNDNRLSKLIVNEFFNLLKEFDYRKGIEIKVISEILIRLKFSSHRFKKRWKSFIFNWYE